MMVRALSQRFCCASASVSQPRAGYKNFVMSDALAQVERQCAMVCPPPRIPPQKVTVIGAGSDVGRIACMMLKQQSVIKTLALYDEVVERKVFGVAHDLAHIDTSTAVEAYQGRPYLKCALNDSDVVLICGGWYVLPPTCCIWDRQLFFQNMQFVRTATMAFADVCPKAILCVQTPPVDCNFALCKYTLEKCEVYNKRKLLGVNINSMRANQILCHHANTNPAGLYVPVVCGTGRCTRVPVFSASKSYFCCPSEKIPCLVRLLRDADDLICRVKSNCEQGHLSIGFSTARCVLNCMKGLFESPAFIESALVEQDSPDKCYGMPICSSPVTVGASGITEYRVPVLNAYENDLLENSKCDLMDMLNLGRCYAVGDDYIIHPCKFPPCPPPKLCEECRKVPPPPEKTPCPAPYRPYTQKELEKTWGAVPGAPKVDENAVEPQKCDDIIGKPQSEKRTEICDKLAGPVKPTVCDEIVGETPPKKKK